VTTGLFLFKAPLSKIAKTAAVFSPICTYYYAEIARNYCLIALLLVLLALCYPKRNERCILYGLLLGLLVQSDVVVLMAAGMISLMWLSESVWKCVKEKTWDPFLNVLKGIWIPLLSLFLLIAQFYRVSDSPVFQVSSYGFMELLKEIQNFACWILIRLTGRGEIFCQIFLLAFLVLLLAASAYLKNLWAAAVLAAAYLFEAAFSVMIYQLHIWHFIALCYVMLWMVWVLYFQKEEIKPAGKGIGRTLWGIQALVVILAVCMFARWNNKEETSSLANALHGSYSDGMYAAEYIRENIPQEALIVSVNVPHASTVLAYLPEYTFYFAGNGQKETYANWSDEQSKRISFEELFTWAKINFPEQSEFYLLDSGESCLKEADDLAKCEILYQTFGETAQGEEYTIYRVILG
ncbi:MAG: hypothetical protein K2N55_10245, partial [Lachnospiraceae bacterium]|nr:hypothetical protein [Lachnospiraceae bacterium]